MRSKYTCVGSKYITGHLHIKDLKGWLTIFTVIYGLRFNQMSFKGSWDFRQPFRWQTKQWTIVNRNKQITDCEADRTRGHSHKFMKNYSFGYKTINYWNYLAELPYQRSFPRHETHQHHNSRRWAIAVQPKPHQSCWTGLHQAKGPQRTGLKYCPVTYHHLQKITGHRANTKRLEDGKRHTNI